MDPDGHEFRVAREMVAPCRCGGSTTRPFCDGTHSQIGFWAASRSVKQAERGGAGDRLGAVGGVELAQDVGQVGLHRVHGQVEIPPDGLARVPARDKASALDERHGTVGADADGGIRRALLLRELRVGRGVVDHRRDIHILAALVDAGRVEHAVGTERLAQHPRCLTLDLYPVRQRSQRVAELEQERLPLLARPERDGVGRLHADAQHPTDAVRGRPVGDGRVAVAVLTGSAGLPVPPSPAMLGRRAQRSSLARAVWVQRPTGPAVS